MFADSEIECVEPRSQANRMMAPWGEKPLLNFKIYPQAHKTTGPLTQLDHGTLLSCMYSTKTGQGIHTHTTHTIFLNAHTQRKKILRDNFCIA